MPWKKIHPPGAMLRTVPFVPGSRAGDFIFTAGTAALDPQGNPVHIGDIRGQTRYTLNVIKDVVEAGGGSMADIVFNTIFIKDWSDYKAMNEVYAEFFPGTPPPRYCVQVGLVLPELLVEIQSVAHV